MVDGSILGSGADITVTADLVDIESGEVAAAAQARGSDVFTLVDEISAQLSGRILAVAGLGAAEADPQVSVASLTTDNLEAFREFQLGILAERRFRPGIILCLVPAVAVCQPRARLLRPAPGRRLVSGAGGICLTCCFQVEGSLQISVGSCRGGDVSRGQDHQCPVSTPRPGALERTQGGAPALRGAGTQHDFAAWQVVTDDYGEVPFGQPADTKILENQHRVAVRNFTQQRCQRRLQGIGQHAVTACRCGDFFGQAALQRRHVNGIDQLFRRDSVPMSTGFAGEWRNRRAMYR